MKIRIHKEGYLIVGVSALIIAALVTLLLLIAPQYPVLHWLVGISALLLIILIIRFFRNPERAPCLDEHAIISGADGKIVAIEEVTEKEYFNDKRKQISVFMSPLDVHVNWYPVAGSIKYLKHTQGSYLVASHPKSSEKNERTTVVVETKEGDEILFRQIAGTIARRIVCYARPGKVIDKGAELGFIKFGSRFDIFLPLHYEVAVTLGQKVKGRSNIIATVPSSSPTSNEVLKR